MKASDIIYVIAKSLVIAPIYLAVSPSHSFGNMPSFVNVTCGFGLRGSTIATCENAIQAYKQDMMIDLSLRTEKESPMSNPRYYAAEHLKLEHKIANAYAVIKMLRAKGLPK